MTRILMALSLAGLLAACGGPGPDADVPEAQPAGSTYVDIGDHVVHFNAIATDQVAAEFASLHNIVRSKNRAMLTVSILNEADNTPTTGSVTVKTVNLTGQLKNVTMRKVEEPPSGDLGGAIYYIGVTPIANRETLIFDISVKPDGVDRSSDVRFKREFFTD